MLKSITVYRVINEDCGFSNGERHYATKKEAIADAKIMTATTGKVSTVRCETVIPGTSSKNMVKLLNQEQYMLSSGDVGHALPHEINRTQSKPDPDSVIFHVRWREDLFDDKEIFRIEKEARKRKHDYIEYDE